MEVKREAVPVAEMIPVILAALRADKPVEMTVTGNSMLPLLKDRVSKVRLIRPNDLKKGDIVLFHRNDDHYVLHRIAAIHGSLYDIVGDNQYVTDRDIPLDSIIAKLEAYSRDGRSWRENDGLYRMILPAIKTVRRYGNGLRRRIVLFVKR